MMGEPIGIQLRRTKGWRLPAGAISVARPSRWGNPNRIVPTEGGWSVRHISGSSIGIFVVRVEAAEFAVGAFEEQVGTGSGAVPTIAEIREALAGHDLACYCALDDPCHRNVLLALANGPG